MNKSTEKVLSPKYFEERLRDELNAACMYLEDTGTALTTRFFASALCGDSLLIKPVGRCLDFLGGDRLIKIPKGGDENYPLPLSHINFYEKNADIGAVFTISPSGYDEKKFGDRELLIKLLEKYGGCDGRLLDVSDNILTVCALDPMTAAECAARLISLAPQINKLRALSAKTDNITASYFARQTGAGK